MMMYDGPPPLNLPQLLNQAVAAARAGRLADAAQICQRILAAHPDQPDALHLLGDLHLNSMRPAEAETAYAAAIRARPNFAPTLCGMTRVCLATARAPEALEHAQAAVAAMPDNAEAHLWHGLALNRLRRFTSASQAINKAIELARPTPAMLAHFAQILLEYHRFDDAETCYAALAELPSAPANLFIRLGAVRERKRAYDAARRTYEAALERQPDSPGALLGIARMQDRVGDDDACLATLDRLLAKAPGDATAVMTRARVLRRQKRFDDAAALLREETARTPRAPADRGMLLIELGHVLDAQGAFDEAFNCIRDGQLLWGQSPAAQRHPPERFLDWVERGPRWITREIVASWPAKGPDDGLPDPAFFLGFPRSGTTLTEQILDAHPNLCTSDELPLVREVMEEIRLRIAPGTPYPQHLESLDDAGLRRCRRTYWNEADARLGQSLEGKSLVDKSPLNTWRLPVIRRIFPEARILFALRDPRDVCLSCFFQRFNPNPGMVLFQTLEGTARLYAAVMNAWFTYRDILGLNWMQTRYEDLVDDVDGQSRKLIDFLGQPWDDRVTAYRENLAGKVVSTPSYMNVQQPIYKRSVARWRNYEKHLAPILDQLAPFVSAFGYDNA